jgi:hypothetical protein
MEDTPKCTFKLVLSEWEKSSLEWTAGRVSEALGVQVNMSDVLRTFIDMSDGAHDGGYLEPIKVTPMEIALLQQMMHKYKSMTSA